MTTVRKHETYSESNRSEVPDSPSQVQAVYMLISDSISDIWWEIMLARNETSDHGKTPLELDVIQMGFVTCVCNCAF